MKINFTNHALQKRKILKKVGWEITLELVKHAIQNPTYSGKTGEDQPTAIVLLDNDHILRVIYEIRSGIITVITFHISRKGRYETWYLRD